MAKKFTAAAEQLQPDSKFNNRIVSRFINCLMHDGKKSVAQRVFYDAMGIIENKVKDVPPLDVFEKAIIT